MNEDINHEGTAIAVMGNKVRVRILQTSACAACHAKKMCMAAESSEKIIDAEAMEPINTGDNVVVSVEKHLGLRAAAIAYVLPCVLLMVAIALLGRWIAQEWLIAIIALALLGIYCLIVRLLEGRISKRFRFVAKRALN